MRVACASGVFTVFPGLPYTPSAPPPPYRVRVASLVRGQSRQTLPHLTDRSTQHSCAWGAGRCTRHSCGRSRCSAPPTNAAPGVGSPRPLQPQPQARAQDPTTAGLPSSPWGLQSGSCRCLCGLSIPKLLALRPGLRFVWSSWAASFSCKINLWFAPYCPQMWWRTEGL